jgi:FtsH-binding integral membrane protein
VKTVGTARVRKPAGAQAALWAYAFVALLALFPPAMIDDMLPIALVYSLIGLYVAGLFVVDLVGKLDHGVLWSWIAATAIVAVIISPTVVAHNL